jgi:hypothetical protein
VIAAEFVRHASEPHGIEDGPEIFIAIFEHEDGPGIHGSASASLEGSVK